MSMFKLQEIPDWMEKYIPEITADAFKTSAELRQRLVTDVKPWEGAMVVMTNNNIDLLCLLKERGLLRDKE